MWKLKGMSHSDIQREIVQSLSKIHTPSGAAEEKLFSAASELLAQRKKRVVSKVQMKAARLKIRSTVISGFAFGLNRLLVHQGTQLAVLAALVVLSFAYHRPAESHSASSGLFDFKKYNDAPELYDAEVNAERMAYEREVEDARKKFSDTL